MHASDQHLGEALQGAHAKSQVFKQQHDRSCVSKLGKSKDLEFFKPGEA